MFSSSPWGITEQPTLFSVSCTTQPRQQGKWKEAETFAISFGLSESRDTFKESNQPLDMISNFGLPLTDCSVNLSPCFPSFYICTEPVRKGLSAAYSSQLCVFKVSKGLITKWWQCHMVLVMARGIRWMQKRGGCEKDTEWQWGSEEAKNAKDSKTSVICNSLVFADCSWIKD